MNFNNFGRQMSTPALEGQNNPGRERQLSLPIPPRPATASPTAPNRPFVPLPTHQESSSQGPSVTPRRLGNLPGRGGEMAAQPCSQMSQQPQRQRHETPYIQALLSNQQRQFDVLNRESKYMNDNLAALRASVTQMENRVYSKAPMQSSNYCDVIRNMKLREEIRQLKIDCHCVFTELDLIGEHQHDHLNPVQLNLNSTSSQLGLASSNRGLIGTEDAPPPIPPRPNPSYQVEPPGFGPLYQRVPPPLPDVPVRSTFSSRTPTPQQQQQRDTFLLGGQRVHRQSSGTPGSPVHHGSSVFYDSANRNSVYEGNSNGAQVGWQCANCTFQNHPDLTHCEMCERPKNSYTSSNAGGTNRRRNSYLDTLSLSKSVLSSLHSLQSVNLNNNNLFATNSSSNSNFSNFSNCFNANRLLSADNSDRRASVPSSNSCSASHICNSCHCHIRLQKKN